MKSLRCRLRMHRWVAAKNADGEDYVRCGRCGKDCTDYPGNAKSDDPNDNVVMRYGFGSGGGGPGAGGGGDGGGG